MTASLHVLSDEWEQAQPYKTLLANEREANRLGTHG